MKRNKKHLLKEHIKPTFSTATGVKLNSLPFVLLQSHQLVGVKQRRPPSDHSDFFQGADLRLERTS